MLRSVLVLNPLVIASAIGHCSVEVEGVFNKLSEGARIPQT